jgi:hypothetical protein
MSVLSVLCDVRGIVGTEKCGRDYLALITDFGAVGLIKHEKVLHPLVLFFYLRDYKPTPTRFYWKKRCWFI